MRMPAKLQYTLLAMLLISHIGRVFTASPPSSLKSSAPNSATQASEQWRELWSKSKHGNTPPTIIGGSEIVPESDIRDPNRRIWIITTACLPWLTGTSVNPLLRAAYLAQERPKGKITLLVPVCTCYAA